ncbi:hypothetical protein KDL01_20555 [Actinospica durhamensis]|uniref:Uncharacterized protein n=1 Tax=Actinospica durhamensis TaxID=1508375 RepID=A0A941IPZ7_9ACTN|nr:hypothetical protein [Actinospica durhamensis]MBR7835679.1 hypothetical protein [Actinospica durhamensis]
MNSPSGGKTNTAANSQTITVTETVGHSAASKPATTPANGGAYPNASAILARLAATGLACTAPSPMAEDAATLFEPGATSLITCNSPGGTNADTEVTVFDTTTHQQTYEKLIESAGTSIAGGQLAGKNWVLESTPVYATSAKAQLGGTLTVIPAAGQSAASGAAALLASAGPLGAHLVNGNEVACDETTAYYGSDGHGGVTVQAFFQGSGLLNVVATSKDDTSDTSQEYTQGVNTTQGHAFDLSGMALSNVNEIDFAVTSPEGSGGCQVQPATAK